MTERQLVQTTGAILMNPQGKILIQQRDDKPGLVFPGHWTTFGGKVEPGEHPDDAIRRELLEEIELEPALRLWRVREFEAEVRGEALLVRQYLYIGRIDREAHEITLNEGQALGFFDADEIDQLPIAFGLEKLFHEFFEVREQLL